MILCQLQSYLLAHKTEAVLISGRKIVSGEDESDRWRHKYRIEENDKISGSDCRRQVELQGAREVHRGKGIRNTSSIGEDDAKYWRTRSIQKEDNFGGSNIDNAVCLPPVC